VIHDENKLKQAVDRLGIDTHERPAHREALRAQMLRTFEQANRQPLRPGILGRDGWLRRMIMERQRTGIAAAIAAGLVVGVALTATFWNGRTSTAYAIERALDALHRVRSMHARIVPAAEDQRQEVWMEFDDQGRILRSRQEKWDRNEQVEVAVAARGEARTWKPVLRQMEITSDSASIRMEMDRVRLLSDPGVIFANMQQLQQRKELEVIVQEQKTPEDPIQVTCTWAADGVRGRNVVWIDPQTWLVRTLEMQSYLDERYQSVARIEYVAYNQRLDPGLFQLAPPPGIAIEDRTAGMGVPMEGLAGAEAAKQIVRCWFEAMIAGDYTVAASLYRNATPEMFQQHEQARQRKLLRLISIGEPVQEVFQGVDVWKVPYTVESRLNGQVVMQETGSDAEGHVRPALVQEVERQPGRWLIIGGVP
jgi:hypothetical protein